MPHEDFSAQEINFNLSHDLGSCDKKDEDWWKINNQILLIQITS